MLRQGKNSSFLRDPFRKKQKALIGECRCFIALCADNELHRLKPVVSFILFQDHLVADRKAVPVFHGGNINVSVIKRLGLRAFI